MMGHSKVLSSQHMVGCSHSRLELHFSCRVNADLADLKIKDALKDHVIAIRNFGHLLLVSANMIEDLAFTIEPQFREVLELFIERDKTEGVIE